MGTTYDRLSLALPFEHRIGDAATQATAGPRRCFFVTG